MDNLKLNKFVNNEKVKFNKTYKQYPLIKRFVNPDFVDNSVQERIMRLGIEAKHFNLTSNDELYLCAVTTLHKSYLDAEVKKVKC